jgi:hypothetical protein
MATLLQGTSITMTAITDTYSFGGFMGEIVSMTFRGTGLTADQRLTVRDTATQGSGNILADYGIEGTSDNADLWGGRAPQPVKGLSIDNNTIAGSWVLTIGVRGT